ncbi:MAG: polysaccharide deacetylase family protein [Spirochaetales bacterium]|nr:polysaccharide deacetylase family protein [Spirochaetales bacterium]
MNTIYTCFPEGKNKALSLSYDDGKSADRQLVGLLNRYGLRGTFHLNGGLLGKDDRISASEAAELYGGHEIAAHSFSHPTLERCPREQRIAEIIEDRKALEQIAGYTVRGFSYPNGSWDRETADLLQSLGIRYARLVDTTGHFYMSNDLFALRTTCHHNDNLIARAEEFIALEKTQYLFWFSVWGHSWEFDMNENWELIEGFCAKTGGKKDIWYTTMIGMADYLDAARQVRVSAAGDFAENPTARAVWLSVNGKIMEIAGGRQQKLT